MSKEKIIGELTDSVVELNWVRSKATAERALEEEIDPVEAINDGLVRGMSIVSELFAAHKLFLPQILAAAKSMYAGLDVLLPAIPVEERASKKTCITAVVEGDVHDIGKNIVKAMLTAGGYYVTDLGKDVPSEHIADEAKRLGTSVVALSTIMTPTLDYMGVTVDALKENGYRNKCKVTIGGPPTSNSFAEEIGADHRDINAQDCVSWLKRVQS